MNRILNKTLTVILVLAVLLGMMAPAAMAAGTEPANRVHSWNLVLADKIAVNFNVNLSEDVPAGAVMQVTDGYGKTAYPISEAEKNEAGNYRFTADLAAAQLADEIKLEVLSGGVEMGEQTYCVLDYAHYVLGGKYSDATKDLLRAMLHYGAAAQTYFDYNTANLANDGIDAAEEIAVPQWNEGAIVTGEIPGIWFYGASLVFDSRVAVRFYFDAQSIEGISFGEYEVTEKNGKYCVEVPGINPQDYDKAICLQVSDGENEMTVSYSPMTYIARQYAKSSNEALRNLVAKMYAYHLAAKVYLETNNGSNGSGDVVADNNGIVTDEVVISGGQSSAVVAAGTQLEEDTDVLTLSVLPVDNTGSDVVAGEDEKLISMDVHVEGIAKDNTVPVLVTLNELAPEFLNKGNIALYHVEDGVTVEMTRVYSISELDAHNEYYYDVATGTVTIAVVSFSEFVAVANEKNPWRGNVDDSWYTQSTKPATRNARSGEYIIYNADQLAAFGKEVDEGNDFAGTTVILYADINLEGYANKLDQYTDGERIIFNPIGYSYAFQADGRVFRGTFDGNGHTISGLYQQGWDLEAKTTGQDYTYSMAGAGLFASVENATIKNLTMDNAYIVMECVDMGVVVGYAQGNCTFENIVVKNSTIANYQRYTGGAIGEVSNGHHKLINVDVDVSTTVSSLWGDFDASLGGLIGGKWGHTYNDIKGENGHQVSVHMDSCDSAATINAYNDVTSAYQWYSYRRCGMLIGNSEESIKEASGRTVATASWLTTKDCTVSYGKWADYHYCLFTDTTSLGARYPWVRVEGSEFNGAYSNPRYGVPQFDGKTLDVKNHTENDGCHIAGDQHNMSAAFEQLYGGGQGCYGGNGHIGNGVTVITAPTPVEKFTKNDRVNYIVTGDKVNLGDLFKEISLKEGDPKLQNLSVIAYVSPKNPEDPNSVRATWSFDNANWTNSSLKFSGSGWATVTIQDYYYCTPTTIDVYVCSGHQYNSDGYCTECGKYIHDLYVYNFDRTISKAATVKDGDGKDVTWAGFDLYLFYNRGQNESDWSILIGKRLSKDNFIMDGEFYDYDFSFVVPTNLTMQQHLQYVYFDPGWTVLSNQMAKDLGKIQGKAVNVIVKMKTTANNEGGVDFVIDTVRIVEVCNHTDGNSCSDYVAKNPNVLHDYDYTYITGNTNRTAIADTTAYKGKAQKFERLDLTQHLNFYLTKVNDDVTVVTDGSEGTEVKNETILLAEKDKGKVYSERPYEPYTYTFTTKKSDWKDVNSKSYVFFGNQSLIKNYQMAQDIAAIVNASETEEVTITITISLRFTNDSADATRCTFYVDRMQILKTA